MAWSKLSWIFNFIRTSYSSLSLIMLSFLHRGPSYSFIGLIRPFCLGNLWPQNPKDKRILRISWISFWLCFYVQSLYYLQNLTLQMPLFSHPSFLLSRHSHQITIPPSPDSLILKLHSSNPQNYCDAFLLNTALS